MTEFNLSEKITKGFIEETALGEKIEEVVLKEDVKEFIRLLKESFKTTGVWTREGALKFIDKLAGEKLK